MVGDGGSLPGAVQAMNGATIGASLPTLLVYGGSLILVIWCVVDAMRRPPSELATGKKAAWVIAALIGWLLFGIIGAAIAVFYLVGPRRKMNAERW
jgi:hypothetical protein